MLRGFCQEFRLAARVLGKSQGFTALAVATLALGIGANTAILSCINAVLFRPMPAARNADRLYHVTISERRVAYVEYEELHARTRSFDLAAYFSPNEAEWRVDGQLHTLVGEYVSGNYFHVLGVSAAVGRVLEPADERTGAGNAVVVSDGLWRQYFRADPAVVGRQVTIDNRDVTIVGVIAPTFRGPNQPFTPGWWMPARKEGVPRITRPDYEMIGTLRPGIDLRQAGAELTRMFASLTRLGSDPDQRRSASVRPVRGFLIPRRDRDSYYTIMGAAVGVVSLTLLIACANIAGFLLARASRRRREIAIRLALGASRGRIVRMLLAESLLLAGLGGAVAVVLSLWATDLLSYGLSLVQEGLRWNPSFRNWDLTPDSRVFAGTFVISLLVGVVCGLTPALQASKTDLTSALKGEAGLRGSGLARLSWRNALVAAQVAGALVLIAASGLFLRSGRQALRFDPGFDTRRLAFTRIEFPHNPDAALTGVQVYRDLQARVGALPEVQAVSMSDGALLEGTGYRDGHKLQVPGDNHMPFGERVIGSVIVGADYFKTIGLPLTLGRDFTERERVVSSRVVIVNEALAQRAFPGENPVGRHVRLLPRLSHGNVEQVEIVGVVKDAAHSDLGQRADPILYRLFDAAFLGDTNRVVLIARTRDDSDGALRSIAGVVGDLGLDVHLSQSTLAENISRQTLPSRITSAFFGLFGALGLLLAAVGLSGVLSYAVARRTKEIGLRMALGADHAAVLRTVIGGGVMLTLAGVVAGVFLAFALTRGLAGFLFGISPTDPLTYLAASLLLMLLAPIACYIPARRAASVDPLIALRHD